ncbi:MAG: dihydrodipicolinate synthase family protein [Planctomycetes bacterium]|nr:dihydrodipicolinate synthase family protein [Planctomycetota bacterium]
MTARPTFRDVLARGVVLPACPLALTAGRKFDERRQRALCRYYAAAGAGGIAVGVHTTQFEIHDSAVGLYRPVLEVAAEEMARAEAARPEPLVRIAGVIGRTEQALREALTARALGYHAVLLGLGALADASDDRLIDHCRAVAGVIPVMGFYLQPAAGGRVLTYGFWRRLAEIGNVVAVKIAPFDRYRTIDVVRAVAEAGRDDVALYTGNDDAIVADLVTPYRFDVDGRVVERRIVGGLLGHWAFWTSKAADLLGRCHAVAAAGGDVPAAMLREAAEITDANAAVFDAANGFAGCIPGIHEVLRRQGLLEGTWCLDPAAGLSPGQAREIDRVCRAYPHLADDDFVAAHLDEWLRG